MENSKDDIVRSETDAAVLGDGSSNNQTSNIPTDPQKAVASKDDDTNEGQNSKISVNKEETNSIVEKNNLKFGEHIQGSHITENNGKVSEENDEKKIDIFALKETIINMAIESWRFASAYERILSKIDAGEQHKYFSQYRWFVKKVEDSLSLLELKFVTVVGREYETGMPATPINLEDFEENDILIVEQMLEPIIVGKNGLVRTGTITLRKVQ
jgi:hypothetical protein